MDVKFTESDGTDCFSGTILHEVGKVITAPNWSPRRRCGNGLHFGEPGVAIVNLTAIPGKVFEVEPIGKVVEISPGKKKAKSLRIIRELDLPQLLSNLAKDKDWMVRKAVAENPNTSRRILSILAKDKDRDVRAAMAGNSNTSRRILSILAKHENYDVRIAVAENPNASRRMLSMLAEDEDLYVRKAVAGNPNTTKRILLKLAKDKDWRVRIAVAGNPNSSKRILSMLAKDGDEDVREAIVRETAVENLEQRKN